MGVGELLASFRTKSCTPCETLKALQDRIAARDPGINAFVALSPTALQEARKATIRWQEGRPCGPLDGVPIAVKDNLVAAGLPATFGSALFAGRTYSRDELPIARLRAAGAIVVGKTNTPEFAIEGYTSNALFGTTRNPFDPALTPGGSSGGSVAAVAAGLVPAAIGTDGGGSIRRPAAYTGLWGLKPGIGTVARGGGLPQILMDFEVVGPFARSAGDLRLMAEVLMAPDRADPVSRRRAPRPACGEKLRVRLVERIDGAPCDPPILEALDRTARVFEQLGHHVEPGPLPVRTGDLAAVWPAICEIGLARLAEAEPDFAVRASRRYVEIAERGAARRASETTAILEIVAALRRETSALFADCDLVLMPACAAMPWAADEPHPDTIAGEVVGPRGHAVYTGWVNAAGHPAVALPVPVASGMPIGVQAIADLGGEHLLLDLAEAYEQAAPVT